MKVVDTQGNEYLPLDATQSGFGLDFGEPIPPGETRRRQTRRRSPGPTDGALVLFTVKQESATENLPLELEIPTGGRSSSRSSSTSSCPAALVAVASDRIAERGADQDRDQRAITASQPPSVSGSRRSAARERRTIAPPGDRQYQPWPRPPRAASTAPPTASTSPTTPRPKGRRRPARAPREAIKQPGLGEPQRAGIGCAASCRSMRSTLHAVNSSLESRTPGRGSAARHCTPP